MDLARAETDLNNLIEERARQHGEANLEEESWKASVRRHNEKIRRRRRAEWFRYWSALASSLRASADEFDRRAARLLEEGDR